MVSDLLLVFKTLQYFLDVRLVSDKSPEMASVLGALQHDEGLVGFTPPGQRYNELILADRA
jgi:hypothetical protein